MIRTCFSQTTHTLSVISCIAVFSAVHGCAILPAPQARTVNFNVSGFNLPAAMAYSTAPGVQSQVPQISKSPEGAVALVRNLVMQSLVAVLEENGRNALLPDFVVAAILSQLTINVSYVPLQCPMVYLMPMNIMANAVVPMSCFIINDIVTFQCVMAGAVCNPSMNMNVAPPPASSTSISGSVTTTNLIMAGWSTQMWQNIFNGALQMVRRGPFGSNFFGATVTLM